MGKRDNAILELLIKRKRMEVSDIAEALGVSQVTARKDLDSLEKRGVLKREHGYAILGGGDDINNRLAYHYKEKKEIAIAAAQLVEDGETVMIESGSCCTLLAEELARSGRDITIITNSAFIASYIRSISGAHVILLGGDFQNSAQVMVGPMLRLCASQFRVKKLFIGVDGYTNEDGFMGNDHLRVQAVRDMAERADEVIAVTESSKFNNSSIAAFGLRKEISKVVTDKALTDAMESVLCTEGISVLRAK